jgi:hypothetical protein
MPNAIKYNVSAETLALKKGNFYIGTGDVGKGPTSSTGYYNGITPPSGGYTIYLNKATGGPSIYTVNTEAQLTGLTSTIAGQTLTTSGACLNWFATQTDKMIFNIDYPPIVTNGLVLNLDAGFTPSYPTTNIYFSDLSGSVTYSIKNIGIPLNQWAVIRSNITEITDNSITPPFYGAQIWSSTINTAVYPNTLHRTWGDGSVNGVIGNLGQGFYRYYMWVRGKSTNTSSCSFQMDISDGSGSSANSGNVLIGTNEEWKLISTWDNGGAYNATKFFDYFLTGSNGDTYYISSIAIIRSDVEDPVNLKTLYTFPGYINYGGVTTSGLQGFLTNGPTFSSTNGGSIVFDGVDDYVQLPNIVQNSGSSTTIEVIMKNNSGIINPNTPQMNFILSGSIAGSVDAYEQFTMSTAGTVPLIVLKSRVQYTSARSQYSYQVYYQILDNDMNNYPVVVQKYYNSDGTLFSEEINYPQIINQTYSYIWSITNSDSGTRSIKHYLNGQQISVLGGAQTADFNFFNKNNLALGLRSNSNISILRLYNRALSASEVLQNFNAQKSRFGL